MKGVGLTIVLVVHWSLWWTNGTWDSLRALINLVFRPIGVPNFITMSMIGLLLSFKAKEHVLGHREQLMRVLKRSFIFLVLGAINNIIYLGHNLQNEAIPIGGRIIYVIFSSNVLTFIGIAQIIMFYFKRLHFAAQVIAVVAIFAIYYLLIPSITTAVNKEFPIPVEKLTSSPIMIVYALFFFDNTMAPFIPYLAIPFLTCIVFSRLSTALARKPIDKLELQTEARKVLLGSLIILVAGIVLGLQFTTGIYNELLFQQLVTRDTTHVWTLQGYPMFLYVYHPSFILFSFGLNSFLTIVCFEIVDLHRHTNRGISIMATFGTYSLMTYLLNPIAVFFPIPLDHVGFIGLYTVFTLLFIAIFNTWDKKWQGKFTADWLVRKFSDTNITALLASRMQQQRLKKKNQYTRIS